MLNVLGFSWPLSCPKLLHEYSLESADMRNTVGLFVFPEAFGVSMPGSTKVGRTIDSQIKVLLGKGSACSYKCWSMV